MLFAQLKKDIFNSSVKTALLKTNLSSSSLGLINTELNELDVLRII